jgi:prophage regulatory protein
MKRFIRRQDLPHITGIPQSTIYQMISDGKFPKPVRLSPRLVGWVEKEIQDWMEARIAERDGARAA